MPRSSSWVTRPNAELLFIDKGKMLQRLGHRPRPEFAVGPDDNRWLSIERTSE
jgi:hypothetical protein